MKNNTVKGLVSVIVPVYNVQKYLPRCIESILKQTYKNFELILVDDGSRDKSGLICDKYAERDTRIKVVHKENGGVSSARNSGIDCARGEWINFVDSDDWITEDCLEKLILAYSKKDVQLVVGAYDQREGRIYKFQLNERNIDFSDIKEEDETLFLYYSKSLEMPVIKLFKSSILIENNVRFSSNVKLGEDSLFCFTYLRHCKGIYIINDIIYHYNKLIKNSATKKRYAFSDRIEWRLSTLKAFIKLIDSFNLTIESRNKLIASRSFSDVLGLLKIAVRENRIEEIENVLNIFWQYLWLDDSWGDRESFLFLKEAIYDKDCENIQEIIIQEDKRHKNLINFFGNIARRLLCPYIERKRDVLISYRKNLK